MVDYEKLLYSAQQVRRAAQEARAWLLDCFGDDEDAAQEIRLANQIVLVQQVERHYEGGYMQFLADTFNVKGEGLVTRYAIVGNARTRREVEAYMPGNYRVIHEGQDEHNGRPVYVIEGRDSAGWTLDGYVKPRLASGLLACQEIDLSHTIMRFIPQDGR